MVTITVVIPDDVNRRFRRAVKDKIGKKYGSLGLAIQQSFDLFCKLDYNEITKLVGEPQDDDALVDDAPISISTTSISIPDPRIKIEDVLEDVIEIPMVTASRLPEAVDPEQVPVPEPKSRFAKRRNVVMVSVAEAKDYPEPPANLAKDSKEEVVVPEIIHDNVPEKLDPIPKQTPEPDSFNAWMTDMIVKSYDELQQEFVKLGSLPSVEKQKKYEVLIPLMKQKIATVSPEVYSKY